MKKNRYGILLLITITGWCIACHKAENAKPPAIEPPVEDTIPAPPINKPREFILYHLVRYNNTPSSLMPYLHPTKIANESMLLNADGSPDISAIQNFARTCKDRIPVTLDLETWPYYPQEELDKTIENFLTVIKAFRHVNTHSPIGFYGVPPKQAYEWKNIDPVNNPSGNRNWLKINDALAPVAGHVELFLPSFYAYDPDTTSWRKMVDATVKAIKKYKPDRPVYAYIWPQYHQGASPHQLQYIDTAIWRYQLEILYDRVDGCIVWTSNKASDGSRISWDPDMPWWQTTKNFLIDKGLVSPFVLDSLYAYQAADSIQVRWATSTDTITDYFVVQRSTDANNFKDISGHILPISTHYTENVYTSTDNNPIDGENYYRLLIVSRQGKEDFSDTVKVHYHAQPETIGNGEVTMSFPSKERYGNAKNALHLLISVDFKGDYTFGGINNATWTEISEKAALPTGQSDYLSSGTMLNQVVGNQLKLAVSKNEKQALTMDK